MAQQIENVHSELSDSRIDIHYDLLGIAEGQPVIVRVYLSSDGGITYGDPLKSVSGDVGVVMGPGKNKSISWDVFEEVDSLESEQVKFKVRADLLTSEKNGPVINPGFFISLNANLGSKVNIQSYGLSPKISMFIKGLGIGIRGEFYMTDQATTVSGENFHYSGFSGGAVVEYDLIRNSKYSLYPFFYIGQTKIQQKSESLTSEYSGYSIFYTPGIGFDITAFKYISLGIEFEYYMAPRVEIVDQGTSTVVDNLIIDGFSLGIVIKFGKNPLKD